MPWNLLILPLVAGYYVLTRCHLFRFTQQRLDRQRLVFDSVLIGATILLATYLIRMVAVHFFPNIISEFYRYSPIKIPFLGTSFSTLVLAFLFVKVGNFTVFRNRNLYIKKAIKKVGNEFELILEDSFSRSKLLQITLDSDKFYIGWVKELPVPEASKYIRIIPVYSGYRNEKKTLVFTTQYATVYAEYVKDGRIREIAELDIDLVIDSNRVVSVGYFDMDMYQLFNKQETG